VATIELCGVTRRFGELTAVDRVDLTVAEGEIVGLLGHNGAGKTTLIRVINGLLAPDAGVVRIDGLDPAVDGRQVRRLTGVLTEYPALDEFLTTRENLEVYAAINSIPRAVAGRRIAELLQVLGLVDRADDPARGLSAGLKQRVALARALVHDPRILLLDEPTTNMDPVAARGVRRLIVDSVRERGRTVVLSTHNLPEAEELCDRIGIMRQGQLLAIGTPSGLRRRLGGTHGVRITSSPGTASRVVAALSSSSAASDERLEVGHVDPDTVEVIGTTEIPAIVARLVALGVDIHRVEPLEPSLEDLYVALHDRSVAVNPAAGGVRTNDAGQIDGSVIAAPWHPATMPSSESVPAAPTKRRTTDRSAVDT
jgi:ABC-2 type transport system ATP-binding protein